MWTGFVHGGPFMNEPFPVRLPAELHEILSGRAESFAILARDASGFSDADLLIFDESWAGSLADVQLEETATYLLVMPYRLLHERGFTAQDDRSPLRVCKVLRRVAIPRRTLVA